MTYSAPIDEKQLIADLQNPAKVKNAFGVLMRNYGEQMYWQIRKIVTTHEDADDLLQNCFIKAWNSIDNFRGDAKLSTWLFKIATNEAINFINKERTRAGGVGAEEADTVLQKLEADPYFDGDEVRKRLHEALAKLPEKQRLVFNMRYFDEMKYEDISDILGTSVGALKANYHHAVKKLEDALGNIDI